MLHLSPGPVRASLVHEIRCIVCGHVLGHFPLDKTDDMVAMAKNHLVKKHPEADPC